MINYSFTMVSGNSKLGPMPAVISGKPSCPSHCPLKKENGGGCYAAAGRIQIHWMKLDNSGLSFDTSTGLKIPFCSGTLVGPVSANIKSFN